MTIHRFAVRTLCAALAVGMLTPLHDVQAQAPASAVTADQSAAALAGAKEALLGFAGAKSLPEMTDHLTDRSVGVISIFFTVPIAFTIGFSDMGATKDKPSPDPTLQKDFTAFLTQYLGDPEKADMQGGLPDTLKGHEREFVKGLMEFQTRAGKMVKAQGGDDSFKFTQPLTTDLQKYKLTVISPSEVKIDLPKPNTLALPGVTSISALQDNGQWRIDLGDPAVILKAMQKSTQATEPKTDPMADKMIAAVKAHDIPRIKTLLHQNPKLVDAQDFVGESALYNTVFWEDISTAAFLIAHGANVNAPNHFGKTPLDEAIFFKRDKMIALLKKHGGKTGPKQKAQVH